MTPERNVRLSSSIPLLALITTAPGAATAATSRSTARAAWLGTAFTRMPRPAAAARRSVVATTASAKARPGRWRSLRRSRAMVPITPASRPHKWTVSPLRAR
jgi:hypothetical protein